LTGAPPASAIFRVAIVAAAVVACAEPAPAPLPEQITPSRGWTGADIPVRVEGQRLYPSVQADARGGGAAVDRRYRAFLVDGADRVALTGVELAARGTLHGVVPEGAPVGTWDLEVVRPDGEVGLLPDAYQVTRTRADRLELTALDPRPFWTVRDVATFEVQLVDPEGEPIHDDLPVRITAVRADGGALDGGLVVTGRDVLLDQIDLSTTTRVHLEGRLDLVGRATLPLTVDRPGDVLLSVRPLEDNVTAATEDISWQAGTDYTVLVDLLDLDEQGAVGAGGIVRSRLTLLDQFGNVVEDPVVPVDALLVDVCGDAFPVALPDLAGITEVSLRLTGATATPECPEQQLEVLLGVDRFASAPFDVRPGPVSRFQVDVARRSTPAGEPLAATVVPVDAWGNTAAWEGRAADLLVTDTIGDVSLTGCTPGDAFSLCTVVPTDADPRVALVVRSPLDGLSGSSGLYEVTAAALDRLVPRVDPSDLSEGIEAGRPFDVLVELLDRFGNDVPADRLPPGTIQLGAPDDSNARCREDGPAERGQIAFTCTLFDATDATRLQAEGAGLEGTSAVFPVRNADLDRVSLTPARTRITAGESVDVTLVGYDAWGNRYRVQDDPRIGLVVDGAPVTPDHAVLGADGAVTVALTLTAAGEAVLQARQSGVTLGVAPPIAVDAGAPDTLAVDVGAPWGWVDQAVPVSVVALDGFGNPAALDATLSLTAVGASFPRTTLSMVDGRATGELTFTDPADVEIVRAATGTGITGTSRTLVVAEDCGTTGPDLKLAFGGTEDAIVCHDSVEASVVGSFAGSTAGSGVPSRYALWLEGTEVVRSTSSTLRATTTRTGTFDLWGLVVDADGCGVEARRTAWIGADDGEAVGPIRLALGDTRLAVGTGSTTLEVEGATTCDGDPADGGLVYLRADRGELGSVTTTGQGLSLTLDRHGDGSLSLDLTVADTGGAGTVHAWVAGGAAAGRATYTVTGDDRRPRLLQADPRGYADGDIDLAVLELSEALDPDTVGRTAVRLSGPATVAGAVDEVILTDDDTTLEVWFDPPLDGTAGAWTLTLASTVTDVAGNRLDGAGSGTASDAVVTFGKVSAIAPDITRCAPTPGTFRPDGDDGTGFEADSTDVSVTADRGVATWVLEILDAEGERIALHRTALGGAPTVGTVSWDGRDGTGRIVDDGTYTARVTAENADGTAGDACTATVHVDNGRSR
jgi:hypothetical protein